jgi:adenylyltransferase/sulfurtransferase
MVLNYKDGPTLRCLYPEPPHPLEVPSCEEAGVIGSIAGTIGSMQATEVIKIILEKEEVLSGKLFIIDSLNFTTQTISFKKNPENSKIKTLGEYNDFCFTENDIVNELSASDLRKMLENNSEITVVDLRDEYKKTDIGFNSTSIPYDELYQKMHLILNKDALVFYCDNGIKSMHVINYLKTVHKMKNLYTLVI